MVEDPSQSDRVAIEALFDRTFGNLLEVARELGFEVEFGADGHWHATHGSSSSSARVERSGNVQASPIQPSKR